MKYQNDQRIPKHHLLVDQSQFMKVNKKVVKQGFESIQIQGFKDIDLLYLMIKAR